MRGGGGFMPTKTLVLAANAGAYCYPWASRGHLRVLPPPQGMQAAQHFDKVVLVNGMETRWLFDPALEGRDTYFFLWDPARCPHYAPGPELLERLKTRHKVYSFQRKDCEDFGLRFNSTMYAPPPEGMYPPETPRCDLLFLGVPKDRLPLLRSLHGQTAGLGLRPWFQIGLTGLEGDVLPEEREGWRITREWTPYPEYLRWVQRTRAILDVCQSIQTGCSLRVMEHLFFGKKLVTNNAVIAQAAFYHPNNIFLLQHDQIETLKDWLDLPFIPIEEEIKEYYKFENWAERFI